MRENTKEILLYLLVGGSITLGISNPVLLTPAIFIAHYLKDDKKVNSQKKRNLQNSFNYLKHRGYVKVSKVNGKTQLTLTKEGRRRASLHQIRSSFASRPKPKYWDKNWYIVVFDVEHNRRNQRDALRHLLKRVGFMQLQKSVWVYPYDCKDEINLVKRYFNMKDDDCRVIISKNIGDDKKVKEFFSV